jgi:hypothetical protein
VPSTIVFTLVQHSTWLESTHKNIIHAWWRLKSHAF